MERYSSNRIANARYSDCKLTNGGGRATNDLVNVEWLCFRIVRLAHLNVFVSVRNSIDILKMRRFVAEYLATTADIIDGMERSYRCKKGMPEGCGILLEVQNRRLDNFS